MKKILIFSHEFPPFGGGAGVVAKHYAKKLSDEGNEITVLTKQIENIDLNVKYKIRLVKNLKKIWILAYIKAVDFDEYDQIILNDHSSVYFAGLFFSQNQLSNSVAFLHGSEPENIFEKPNIKSFKNHISKTYLFPGLQVSFFKEITQKSFFDKFST